LLRSFNSLELIINLPEIPKEFSNINFNRLLTLSIHFGSQLQSLKGLQNLSNLEYLSISNFTGKELPAELSKLSSLVNISISNLNLENIDVLTEIKNFVGRSLQFLIEDQTGFKFLSSEEKETKKEDNSR
jgi:Leucine-rich repeat (LRR) protein